MRARGYGRVKYLTFFSVRNLSMAPYRDTCPLDTPMGFNNFKNNQKSV